RRPLGVGPRERGAVVPARRLGRGAVVEGGRERAAAPARVEVGEPAVLAVGPLEVGVETVAEGTDEGAAGVEVCVEAAEGELAAGGFEKEEAGDVAPAEAEGVAGAAAGPGPDLRRDRALAARAAPGGQTRAGVDRHVGGVGAEGAGASEAAQRGRLVAQCALDVRPRLVHVRRLAVGVAVGPGVAGLVADLPRAAR